ncbi:DMT family transporter [Paenibacillus sp. MER TA 81-3]|uniref:DMT family transporter n=1 Tax=Paenibacillus sp. MER TA 81-3 TaxID=2939573 RepID=UPI00203BA52C|nr:DMT family transporter [Paenibacillus sp. MER TA 81-3]MCM3342461.1 DMT family transporter [Paenibacillus sp. MER TA 81-3]
MKRLSQKKTFIFLAFLVVMWGLNWPLTKIGLLYAPPLLFAGIRTFIGGLILLIFAIPRYKNLRLKETWHIYLISAVLNIILYYGLMTFGLIYMPAGLFSAIVFLQPVLLGIFSWMWLGESMFTLKIIGLILGFSGVAIISAGGLIGHASIIGILLALGTALSWSFGTVFMKKTSVQVDSIWVVSLQLLIGGLFLIGSGTTIESWSDIVWNITFISHLLFISIFVIALGWLTYFVLIGSGEASKVGSYTFLIPLISNIISITFLHEAITINLLVGLFLILISIYLVNSKQKNKLNPKAR